MADTPYFGDVIRDISSQSVYHNWTIGDATLYGKDVTILFLTSYYWLIGDIDKKDFEWEPLVKELEKKRNLAFRFYRTTAGFRFFITSGKISPNSSKALALFQVFDVDPKYIAICKGLNSYRARLSPKPREVGFDSQIATFLYSTTSEQEYELELRTMISVHDHFCCNTIQYDLLKSDTGRTNTHETTTDNLQF